MVIKKLEFGQVVPYSGYLIDDEGMRELHLLLDEKDICERSLKNRDCDCVTPWGSPSLWILSGLAIGATLAIAASR